MCEVVRGDKHNLRKSANRNAQISVIHSAHCTDLCVAICRFPRLCLSPRTTSRTISFSISNTVFGINLYWATARSQQLLFVALAAGLWCFTASCHAKSLPLPPTPSQTDVCSTMGRKHKTVVFSQFNAPSYKFAAPRHRPPCRLFRWASNLAFQRHWKIAQLCCTYKDKVSARLRHHVSNSVVFVHRAGTLTKGYPISKLFSKAETLQLEKEININLVYSSCLKHANEKLLGDQRQADQRTQSFHFPIVIHQALDPAARVLKLLVFTCTRAFDRLRTHRCVESTRRRGNHMHDHSRFQRDIDWRHRRLSLSLSLSLSLFHSQKSLTHNIGSASALPTICLNKIKFCQ